MTVCTQPYLHVYGCSAINNKTVYGRLSDRKTISCFRYAFQHSVLCGQDPPLVLFQYLVYFALPEPFIPHRAGESGLRIDQEQTPVGARPYLVITLPCQRGNKQEGFCAVSGCEMNLKWAELIFFRLVPDQPI